MKRPPTTRRSTLAVLMAVLASLGSAYAVSADAQESRQSDMAECNRTADGRVGASRQAYISACLAKPASPQVRMKTCNQQAVGRTGDARREFMSTCLHNDG